MKTRRAILAVVLVSAAFAAASGCSRTASGPAAPVPPPLGPVPTITEPAQITLPIDAVAATSQQVGTLARASAEAGVACMRSFGLDITVAQTVDYQAALATYGDRRFDLMYGRFDPQDAKTVGYGLAVNLVVEKKLSDTEQQVYFGKDTAQKPVTSFAGKTVPPGGCLQKGAEAVGGLVVPAQGADLPAGGPRPPMEDPRMNAVDAQWSSCMKSKGFAYASPRAAISDPRWKEPGKKGPSALETQVATADMACKESTNLVGQAVAIETAYQKQYFDKNATAIAQYRTHLAERLKSAETILAASGG